MGWSIQGWGQGGLGHLRHLAFKIRNGNPDLVVLYDYVRYRRPKVPASWAGKRLDNPQAVSDQELLQYLGASAASK